MKYYVVAVEQYKDKDGNLVEIAPQVKKYDDFKSAETYFLSRSSEIANSSAHNYGYLHIYNSYWGMEREYQVGEYIDEIRFYADACEKDGKNFNTVPESAQDEVRVLIESDGYVINEDGSVVKRTEENTEE